MVTGKVLVQVRPLVTPRTGRSKPVPVPAHTTLTCTLTQEMCLGQCGTEVCTMFVSTHVYRVGKRLNHSQTSAGTERPRLERLALQHHRFIQPQMTMYVLHYSYEVGTPESSQSTVTHVHLSACSRVAWIRRADVHL